MRKCDSCGKLYQETKDVFCPHCGAVAEKQCSHSSSFDSKRYDRGELYKYDNTQYKNTTYNQGYEPHAQRQNNPYTPQNTGGYDNKAPQINLPDLKTILSKGKGQNGKPLIGIIVFVVILAFNAITAFVNNGIDGTDYWEDASSVYIEEDIGELYTVVDKATIEMVDVEGEFKTFTLEISGMGFDDYLPQSMLDDISTGVMTEDILSENTFVKALICDFKKAIVPEESYNNAIDDSYLYTGEQIEVKCKYKFTYNFDFGEIVHIISGVNFYLENGMYINAELPFSAFSVSEDGEITYYTSYADSDTAWNTVFSECSNEQELNRDVTINFDSVVTVEGE